MPIKRKATKRSKTKYPGLAPNVNSKLKWEYMDQDYIDSLTEEEKLYLSNFMDEYMGGNFQHPGKKLHKTKKEKRECYTRNNARNRDLYAIFRTRGGINNIEDYQQEIDNKQLNPEDVENNLLELIDLSMKKDEQGEQ